ncbi:uncharacterized protein LOC127051410 [Gopherus flavomarginatus]|uniref:uncharacterized protein LOC127051410 n=1 Tax=Gopherus flavomarginatus TaxID=286002 RepID=UPI0021CBA5B8|nr:uncharacterized protein LOC127051410 [Gopherus flavomarginatus]
MAATLKPVSLSRAGQRSGPGSCAGGRAAPGRGAARGAAPGAEPRRAEGRPGELRRGQSRAGQRGGPGSCAGGRAAPGRGAARGAAPGAEPRRAEGRPGELRRGQSPAGQRGGLGSCAGGRAAAALRQELGPSGAECGAVFSLGGSLNTDCSPMLCDIARNLGQVTSTNIGSCTVCEMAAWKQLGCETGLILPDFFCLASG